MKKVLISLSLITSFTLAFNFDIWTSKITLNEAIEIAKNNNIPFQKDTLGSGNPKKTFNEKYLYLQKYPNNRIFRYSTTLLNERADVFLYFTKEDKKLYTLKVRWTKSDKTFRETLYKLLDKKYGERNILIPSNIGEFILFKQRQWQKGEETIIRTKTSMGSTNLLYIDIEETNKEKNFKEKIKTEKKEKALIKDADKF